MNKYILGLILLTLFLPVSVLAQLATSTGNGVSISSDFVEQVRGLDGEDIEHAPVSLYLGVRKRFSASQSGIANLDITPGLVLNPKLLELYVRKIVLTEPISELTVGEAEVVTTIKGSAKLIGFIPVRIPYMVMVDFDTKVTNITATPIAWWSFLTQTQSSEEIATSIQAHLEGVSYLSRIQLRAIILGAIVNTVSS